MPELADFDQMELEDGLCDFGSEDDPEVLFEVAEFVFGTNRPTDRIGAPQASIARIAIR